MSLLQAEGCADPVPPATPQHPNNKHVYSRFTDPSNCKRQFD